MGTISFNSACFYRYLVADTDALAKNLGDDATAKAQARETAAALIRAAVLAIPSGKQNSMAAHNFPSLVMVHVRDGEAPCSLTNAFVDPARAKPGEAGDLVSQSIQKLGNHYAALEKVYGKKGQKDLSFVAVGDSENIGKAFAKQTGATDRGSLDALIAASVSAAFGDDA
jgi:CRISPR system Cascade subunit CasC